MRPRIVALSLAPLLAASLAHAQAPGDPDDLPPAQPVIVTPPPGQPVVVAPGPGPAIAAPGMTPVIAPAPPPEICAHRRSVMDDRWAIALSIGSMSLAPRDLPDDQTQFAVGELALRFRIVPRFELELTAGGGRERTSDNMDGELEVNTAMLAGRIRFNPEGAWNWFLTGGLGGASVTRHDATRQERDDATQPMGMIGVGVEHRWTHLALQAELRAVALGKQNTARADAVPAAMTVGPAPAAAERSGGSLSIGLGYYF